MRWQGWTLAMGLWTCGQAKATLGEPATSIERDQVSMQATHKSSAVKGVYTVHELEVSGTTIREYANSRGIVFGFAWSGLTHPDLTSLLGTYFSDYKSALNRTARQHGRRRRLIQSAKVVVQKWGHMRSLRGRAYAPAQLPAGVSPYEIQ